MKTRSNWLFVVGILGYATTHAQVVPTTPTKFGKRSTGAMGTGSSTVDAGAKPAQNTQPIIKQVSYIALSESRQWTSADGKALVGKLIAWEQQEEVLASAADAGKLDRIALPKRPTVLRGQAIRLLIDQKPFEVPLDRLSQADRDFVAERDAAIAKQAEQQSSK